MEYSIKPKRFGRKENNPLPSKEDNWIIRDIVTYNIEYEAKRQIELINKGEKIIQETRKWDDDKGESFSMRSKEDANDYRYFPDPDILQVNISQEVVDRLKKKIPLMPEERKEKYINEYNLPEYDAEILTSSKEISQFFEDSVKMLDNAKEISNWIMTEIMKIMKDDIIPISPQYFTDILKMLLDKKITRSNAKELLYEVCEKNMSPIEIANKRGMLKVITKEEIEKIVEKLIESNPNSVLQYEENSDKIVKFFVGGVMKETKGKADPILTKKIIVKLISEKLK